jgi:catechol 2,3-dioxygenase-like lactoylglutathione lyase family enzyme
MSYYKTNPKRLPLLGHVSFGVKSLDVSKRFYAAIFKPFGVHITYEHEKACGFGHDEREPVDLSQVDNPVPAGVGTHMAFNAPSREAVDAFYKAALENGGTCYGPPGLRPQYNEHYYACFVLDPDGHRLEAVYQQPLDLEK